MVISRAQHPGPLERLPSMSFSLPQESGNRGILIFSADGLLAGADPNVFSLLGVSPTDIPPGATEADAHHILKSCFADPDAYAATCQRLRDNPQEAFEDVLETAGRRRVIHRYTSPLVDQEGKFIVRVEVYSDITKRRALEKAARRAWDELQTTQEQLVQSEKLRAVGEIASGVAHDFNNTLGVILGNVQLLLKSVKDEETRARLKSAERAALDGADTVRRIQEFTRKKSEGAATPIRLRPLASEVVEMMRPVWQEGARSQGRNIEIRLAHTADVWASANGAELREVMMNILLNAIQAMPEGGRISISTGRTGSDGWIRIADTGIGMTPEVRGRVFDPFFTTRGVEGTGLGMSVVYGIISRHGGTISIESEPGKGAAVTVFLPEVQEPELQPSHEGQEAQAVRRAKILVVDDEETFVDVLAEMLREFGHEVVAAGSGAEAVGLFKDGRFDMVFTDLGMPHMSGAELAAALKKISPVTPVALLTGWGATLDKAELNGSAVDITLSKPVDMEELSAVVTEALARAEK